MNSFELYMELGFKHITDFNGLDHMLFLLVLAAVSQFKHWKWLIWMVTAFTLAHSMTLIISGLNWYRPSLSMIEFFIPVTIILTALFNLTKSGSVAGSTAKIFLAGIFGLIHGFGFSNYFRMVVMDDESKLLNIGYFTLGIELGQLLIVLIVLILGSILTNIFRVKTREWNIFVSGLAMGIALLLAIENWPF